MTNPEILLVVGILAFYLYDSATLLFSDEILWVRSMRGWHVCLGSDAMVAGRYLAFPSLFSPGAPIFLATWGIAADHGTSDCDKVLAAVAVLRWPCWLIALLLFIAAPVMIYMHVSPSSLLALLTLLYATAAASMAYVVSKREVLGLPRAALVSIAVDVIACPPFALNLVRRITLRHQLKMSLEEFGHEGLSTAAMQALSRRMRHRMAVAGTGPTGTEQPLDKPPSTLGQPSIETGDSSQKEPQ